MSSGISGQHKLPDVTGVAVPWNWKDYFISLPLQAVTAEVANWKEKPLPKFTHNS